MQQRTIFLLFGGESPEHEVSIRSAQNVFAALDKTKYNVLLCYIDKNGQWWHTETIEPLPQAAGGMTPQLGRRAVRVSNKDGEKLIEIDCIVPILHGQNGEDGSVQGLAQLMHVPIVGCGIIGSAACMDKDVAKRLLKESGIKVVDYVVHRQGDPIPSYKNISAILGNTLFVKPAQLGSSVGVSKVSDADSFVAALGEAHAHDCKVLIERAVSGRELECAVMGNDKPEASVVGEIQPGESFYSYDDKYADDSKAATTTSPNLPKDVAETIRKTAIAAFTACECRGLARIDFFLADDGSLYVNEINTMPGFTDISMYPQLWRASGVDYPTLLDKLIALALQ